MKLATIIKLFFGVFLALFCLYFSNKKVYRITIIGWLSIGLFFLIAIVNYYYIFKYRGNDLLLFPDEFTYIYKSYNSSIFDEIVKILINIGGISFVRSVNIFLYIFGLLTFLEAMLNEYPEKKFNLKIIFLVILYMVGSYWAFFILKEAMTICGISFYLSGYKKKQYNLKLIGLAIIFMARIDLFAIFVTLELWERLDKLYIKIIMLSMIFGSIVFYLNHDFSYGFKLGLLARRHTGGLVNFDSLSYQLAHLKFVDFIFSPVYLEAVVDNIIRSFWPFPSATIYTFILTTINLVSIFIVFITKPKNDLVFQIFVVTIIGLLLTFSVSRYINTIMIPFISYFLLESDLLKKSLKSA